MNDIEQRVAADDLRDAAQLMLDELGRYERDWMTSGTGYGIVRRASAILRKALDAITEAPDAEGAGYEPESIMARLCPSCRAIVNEETAAAFARLRSMRLVAPPSETRR